MANKKIWELTELVDAIGADIIPIGDDIAGTPLLKFITLLNFFATLKVPIIITSTSGSALIVGPNGATNPVFKISDNIASQAAGIDLIGRAAGAGAELKVLSSGADEDLILTPKGVGEVVIPTAISIGESSAVAGTIELVQGTEPSGLGTTSIKIYAPTGVTSYKLVLPGASVTGFLLGTDAAGPINTLTFVAFTGSGDVVRATTPTFITSAIISANGITGKVPRVLSAQFSTTDTLDAAVITTTETLFATKKIIPANLLVANKVLKLTIGIQFTGTAGPTVIFRVKLGAVVIYLSTAQTLLNQTNKGTGAVFIIQGTAAAGASVNVITSIPAMGPTNFSRNDVASPALVATNADQDLQVSVQFSAGTAGNTITLQQFLLEELN